MQKETPSAPPPLSYEEKYREAFQQNVENIAAALEQGELNTKIDNFCNLHGFNRDAVVEEIKSNRIVAACFAKNPNKQNFYEKIAAAHIDSLPEVSEFEMLKTNALYVVSGGLHSGKDVKKSGAHADAKSIDFKWRHKNATFYASHKYTQESGGSQDNQYKDLQTFIKAARDNTNDNVYFVAIADGAYYLSLHTKTKMTRLQYLKNLAAGGKVYACQINDLTCLMKSIVG